MEPMTLHASTHYEKPFKLRNIPSNRAQKADTEEHTLKLRLTSGYRSESDDNALPVRYRSTDNEQYAPAKGEGTSLKVTKKTP